MKNSLGMQKINIIKESKTLDEDKKEYMNPTSEATYEAAMEQMKKAQVYTKDGYLNVEKSSDNMIELINKQLDEMEKEKKNEGK